MLIFTQMTNKTFVIFTFRANVGEKMKFFKTEREGKYVNMFQSK